MPQSKRPSRNLPIVTELHLLMLRSDLNLPLLSADVSNTGFSSNQNLEYEFRTKPLCRGSGGRGGISFYLYLTYTNLSEG